MSRARHTHQSDPFTAPARDEDTSLSLGERLLRQIRLRRPIHPLAIVQFARALGGLLGAGIGLTAAFQALARQFRVESPRLSAILESAGEHLRAGGTIAEGFAPHKDALDPALVELIGIGERAGVLESKILPRIVDLFRAKARFQANVLTALIYPAFIVIGSIAVTAIALIVLVPAMETAYAAIGDPSALPRSTRLLQSASNLAVATVSNVFAWICLLAAVVGGVVASRNETVRERCDALLLRVPLLARLIALADFARAFNTLGILLDSGLSMPEAVQLAGRSASNRTIRQAFAACLPVLRAGGTLTQGFNLNRRLFGDAPRLMIESGELSGTLPRRLGDLAEQHQEEAEDVRNRLKIFTEYGMTAVLACYVGLIAFAIYAPIFTLYEKLAR